MRVPLLLTLVLIILSACDTEPAPTEDLTPREAEISATKGWQPSGFVLKAGDRATVEYVSGEWSHFPKEVPLFAGAYPPFDYVCAEQIPASECVEPVPDYRTGALIGRTRDELFRIGDIVSPSQLQKAAHSYFAQTTGMTVSPTT